LQLLDGGYLGINSSDGVVVRAYLRAERIEGCLCTRGIGCGLSLLA